MKTRRVTRYYCDHCGRGMQRRPSMERHEQTCYKNPERVCVLSTEGYPPAEGHITADQVKVKMVELTLDEVNSKIKTSRFMEEINDVECVCCKMYLLKRFEQANFCVPFYLDKDGNIINRCPDK